MDLDQQLKDSEVSESPILDLEEQKVDLDQQLKDSEVSESPILDLEEQKVDLDQQLKDSEVSESPILDLEEQKVDLDQQLKYSEVSTESIPKGLEAQLERSTLEVLEVLVPRRRRTSRRRMKRKRVMLLRRLELHLTLQSLICLEMRRRIPLGAWQAEMVLGRVVLEPALTVSRMIGHPVGSSRHLALALASAPMQILPGHNFRVVLVCRLLALQSKRLALERPSKAALRRMEAEVLGA